MDIEARYLQIDKIAISRKTESSLREALSILLLYLHNQAQHPTCETALRTIEAVSKACYRKLRQLENMCAATAADLALRPYDLREVLEALCYASDLALSGTGKRVRFYAGNAAPIALCCIRSLETALMNLLLNACLHGTENEVFVTLSARADHAAVSVQNSGICTLPRLHYASLVPGSGLAAAHSAAKAGGGTLLFSQKGTQLTATLCLPLHSYAATPVPYTDFVDLLCDRLSPVYVGLSGLCRCPL